MSKKLIGTLLVTAVFSTGAFAQSTSMPASSDSGTQTQNADNAKQLKKQQKRQKKQESRNRNQNGSNGPAETSSSHGPASGTGSQ
ncbi:hypothetical protein PQR62_19190 [Herbaspirillum lusitanum]|jgi:nitrate reductase cytochrome c-type subunit|uniref:Uncharacterized protein n=1 Tax=Herbaspirillum lusitanum TaxID=213312 RepID=A0ABW9ADC4_9BURK